MAGPVWADQGGAPQWKVVKDAGGVTVATRAVADWPIKEFRATTRVHASLERLLALMADVPRYPTWFADTSEARLVKGGSGERWTYVALKAPFPVSSRDLVTHFRISQDASSHVVRMEMNADPALVPPQKRRVRVPRLEGSWTFRPLAGDEVEVTYQVKSDPGGSLPAWLANSTVADGPFKTLAGMKRVLTER